MILKQELLEAVNFDFMVEECTKVVAMYYCGLSEESAEGISENILENFNVQDLFYNTTLSHIGTEADLKNFIRYDAAMKEATDSFIFRLNQYITEEVNQLLPEGQKLIPERAH